MRKNKFKNKFYVGIDTSLNNCAFSLLEYDFKNNDEINVYLIETEMFKLNKGDKEILRCNNFVKKINKKFKNNISYVMEGIFPTKFSSRKSIFNFSLAKGIIKTILTVNKCNYIEYYPQRWKKIIGITSVKDTAIMRFKDFFVNCNDFPQLLKNHHIIESVLMVIAYLGDSYGDRFYIFDRLKGYISLNQNSLNQNSLKQNNKKSKKKQ